MSDYGSTPPPAYGAVGAQGTPPPNNLVWAILSTVLCPPLGIASIVFATKVNSKWAMGDAAGAQAASEKAKGFAIWGVIAWVVFAVFNLILFFGFGGTGS